MSKYIHKSHNVTILMYHLVFPAKYRRAVIDAGVDRVVKEVCLEIEKRYQIKFLEIGTDDDHVHFLVQSVPTYSVTKLVTMIKSITAREVFQPLVPTTGTQPLVPTTTGTCSNIPTSAYTQRVRHSFYA